MGLKKSDHNNNSNKNSIKAFTSLIQQVVFYFGQSQDLMLISYGLISCQCQPNRKIVCINILDDLVKVTKVPCGIAYVPIKIKNYIIINF